MDGYTALKQIIDMSSETYRKHWQLMGHYLFSSETKDDPVAAFIRDREESQWYRGLFQA